MRNLTQEMKDTIAEEYTKTDMTATQICKRHNISRPTLYRVLKTKGIEAGNRENRTGFGHNAYGINYDVKDDEVIISVNGLSLRVPRESLFSQLEMLIKLGVSSEYTNILGEKSFFDIKRMKY